MRIVLVTCPNFFALDRRYHAHIPLGPLSLAAVLQREGHDVRLVDPNRLALRGGVDRGGRFHEDVAGVILRETPDLVGFSTLSNSYHQVLRIIGHVKAAAPDLPVLLGGPHASVVDVETLQSFPRVDMVLRGEGEVALPRLLVEMAGARRLEDVPGLTFRARDGTVCRNPPGDLLADLDALPVPAYAMLDLPRGTPLPLDVGRGCPFDCSFCSTCHFWGRRSRLKSVERIAREMRALMAEHGTRVFDIPHDLFTLDRRRVLAFCDRLQQEALGVSWSCFARVDCMDEGLLEKMRAAGCCAVAYGIETASPRMQRVIGKGLDLAGARQVVAATVARGMVAALSFIVGFPEESPEEALATVELMDSMARNGRGLVRVGCSPLVPYAGSRYWQQSREGLRFWGFPATRAAESPLDAVSLRTVRRHPQLFSDFTWTPHPTLSYAELSEMAEVFSIVADLMPATWRRLSFPSPQALLEAFRASWSRLLGTKSVYRSGSVRGDGYRWLVRAFTRFARAEARQSGDGLLAALAGHEERRFRVGRSPALRLPSNLPAEAWDHARLARSRLQVAKGVVIRREPYHVHEAAMAIVAGAELDPACLRPSWIMLVPLGGLAEVVPLTARQARMARGLDAPTESEAPLLAQWLLRGMVLLAAPARVADVWTPSSPGEQRGFRRDLVE